MRADRRRRGRQAVLAAALIAAAAAAAVYSLRRFTTEPTGPPSSRPPDAAPTPIDRAEMLRRIEARLRADLDAKYPMLAPGDAAALELLTGQVVRGTYRGLLAGEAQIETGEGPRALPLDQLAPHSRVRVDADFRTGTIAHRARTEAGSGSASLSERPPSPP
jgi:hypothetical protein